MDAGSGSGNVNDRKNLQNVRPTYRAVPTQPDREVQGYRTSSSASSSTSDRGGTSTSAGRVSDPSPSVASLSSKMSTLNPHAKEFKLDPNAKSFTPVQRHMHGTQSSVRAGPSFAAQPPAPPMLQQIYNSRGPQAVNSRQPKFTHFVSLPLAIYPELLKGLVNFKIEVLKDAAADSGIDESIFAKLLLFSCWSYRMRSSLKQLQRLCRVPHQL
ncbi:polyadenylate-binding protein-interacting protein 4-like [Salvia hispanica]|uniref:polyadenylate-binding protein-interacting protein 4-like n=1 Tax=Salvia hispanica TaxID=49212 RepID=UPI0020094578|nr:polyadenylate-binding protein-interacting protein 4-like [Salvia hispanica]